MNKIRLSFYNLKHLDDSHYSGSFVDITRCAWFMTDRGIQSELLNNVDAGVFHILRHDVMSQSIIAYAPTLVGYALWLLDRTRDIAINVRCVLIWWLASHGFAYVPEASIPQWNNIGKKPPAKYPYPQKALTWGELRNMLNVGSWRELR